MTKAAAPIRTGYTGVFPGRPDQVGTARHQVARYLTGCPATDDTLIVLSELAANAILHSRSRGQQFTIRVQLHHDHVSIECQDAGGPWRPRRPDDRPHGLTLVEALTGPQAWGVHVTSDGSRIVWATLTW